MLRSDREHFLAQLPKRLRTQNNFGSAYPLYCVQEEERVYGIQRDWVDAPAVDYEWVCEGDPSCSYDDDTSLLADFPHHRLQLDATGGIPWEESDVDFGRARFRRIYYKKQWAFVSAHLTEAAAEDYIAQNRHNLKNPRVFVTSQHRCYEWIAVVEHLHLTGHVPSTEPGGDLEQLRQDNAALAACLRSFGEQILAEHDDLRQIMERYPEAP